MTNDLWLNVGTKDTGKAKVFFESIGFEYNQVHSNSEMASFFVGQNRVVINFFPEHLLSYFMKGQPTTSTGQSNEVLFSIGASSVEEANHLADKVRAAGGTLYSEPSYTDGWMYGFGFIDLDGHRWNVLYMDMAKFPKQN